MTQWWDINPAVQAGSISIVALHVRIVVLIVYGMRIAAAKNNSMNLGPSVLNPNVISLLFTWAAFR